MKIKGRPNVIGALIGKGLVSVGFYDTPVNAAVFFEWTVRDLLPNLPANSVVVINNATFHKRLDIQNAILSAGHILEFLPTCSPDLNPIENKWADLKGIRRKLFFSVTDLFKIESLHLSYL